MQTVDEFLDTITDEGRRSDAHELVNLMQATTGVAPIMWGSIIGFGKYHYVYETGREGDTVAVGFAPRKNALVVYGIIDCEQNTNEIDKLGKVKLGKGCVYINKLADIDTEVFSRMVLEAYRLRNNVQ